MVGFKNLNFVLAAFLFLKRDFAGAIFELLARQQLPLHHFSAAIVLIYLQPQGTEDEHKGQKYGQEPTHGLQNKENDFKKWRKISSWSEHLLA